MVGCGDLSPDKVLEGTPEVLVRSLWDVTRGHVTGGILMEGRYKISDVRDRTRVRSAVFESLMRGLREADIHLAVPVVDLRR